MESQNVQFIGAPCGKHGPYTFYKGFKYFKDNQFRILTLGEFFFLKILKEGPICIGELQLLWDNAQENQLLTSVRLYFLPENTPSGRENYHGEDEILAFSEKLILRIDDLVSLIITDRVKWKSGLQLLPDDAVTGAADGDAVCNKFFANTDNSGLDMTDMHKEQKELVSEMNNEKSVSTDVRILSFSQYCRYRAIIKRLENMADKWLKNKIVCALGGITSGSRNNRILFCRDTFDSVDLDDYELRMDHLAPNLKGRPRKKRSSTRSDTQDSDSNETASDVSSPSSVKIGKRDSALRNGFKLDKDKVSKDEQAFLFNLHKFMKRRNTPIGRIPSLGFKQIDLFYFWTYSQKLGGYEQITNKRLWKHLYDQLGGNPGSTSAATCTRRHYEKLLLPYERHVKGEEQDKPLTSFKNRRAQLLAKAKLEMRKRLHVQHKIHKDDDLVDTIVKKRRRCRLDLSQDKVKLWENIRRARAMERDKIKKVTRHPKTVKNLLNSSAEKRLERESLDGKEEALVRSLKEMIKSESGSRGENRRDTKEEASVKREKSPVTSDNGPASVDSKSLVSQSRLFRPDPVQSKISATNSEDILSAAHVEGRAIPLMAGHPGSAAMFYPPTFIPMGQGLPLGLPVMHQLPLAMPAFLNQHPSSHHHQSSSSTTSTSTDKQHTSYRPNILRTSSSHSGSPSSSDRPSVIQHAHQNKTSTSHLSSREASPAQPNNVIKSPHLSPSYIHSATPAAHSGSTLKRHYNSDSHIPHHHRTSSKSLLFDFEAPKRPKMETAGSTPAAHSGNSSKMPVIDMEDQPTDLSMKTLRKLQQSGDKSNGETIDLRCYSPSYKRIDSPSVSAVRSTSSSSLSSSSKYMNPGYARGTIPPDVVIPSVADTHPSVFSKSPLVTPSAHSNYGNKMTELHNRPLVPAHSKKPVTESMSRTTPTTPSSLATPSVAAAVGAAAISPPDGGIVHPAFPYLRPTVPQTDFFPTPLQLQQMYEAQIRANAAQAAAFEDLMKRDCGQFGSLALPLFVPQFPVHTQATKDKTNYAQAK